MILLAAPPEPGGPAEFDPGRRRRIPVPCYRPGRRHCLVRCGSSAGDDCPPPSDHLGEPKTLRPLMRAAPRGTRPRWQRTFVPIREWSCRGTGLSVPRVNGWTSPGNGSPTVLVVGRGSLAVTSPPSRWVAGCSAPEACYSRRQVAGFARTDHTTAAIPGSARTDRGEQRHGNGDSPKDVEWLTDVSIAA